VSDEHGGNERGDTYERGNAKVRLTHGGACEP